MPRDSSWCALGVLERAAGLTTSSLDAIAELEQQVVEADGGRLKLEWGTLRERSGEQVEDLLWWEGERLVGFLGCYGYGNAVELAGMVAPDARRRGIGGSLVDAALGVLHSRGTSQALLIVPRPSEGGKHLALRRGGALDHSEHALVLCAAPAAGERNPDISLRVASPEDVPLIAELLENGFGNPAPANLVQSLHTARRRTLMIDRCGSAVGTLRIDRDGEEAGIYGLVVDPAWQGRGIGREALTQVCGELRDDGTQRVRLEVAVDNDRALGLYTSLGFTPVATEDYYALPTAPMRGSSS